MTGRASGGSRPFAGTGRLLRLALRLDRLALALWLLTFVVLAAGVAAALDEYYPLEADRAQFAERARLTPAVLALTGPAVGLERAGGLLAWRIGALCVVLAGLMSIFTLVRHTRVEEETGRLDLVRSTPVGRLAPPAAALLVTAGANAALALALAATLVASGLPAGGSLVFGAAVGAGGLFFAAVAAVTAQLFTSARAAKAMATLLLGLAFLLRAIGDASNPTGAGLSWASPIGWAQRTGAFVHVRWWLFGLLFAAAGALLAVAFVLLVRRDVGSGVLAARLGRERASPRLASVSALGARLHRGGLATWTAGYAVAGAALGAVAH
ncbi:ABC transporter permease, partial [Frankia sp. CNm7]|nr:ABC transporter permease [Frankia nepalensis]